MSFDTLMSTFDALVGDASEQFNKASALYERTEDRVGACDPLTTEIGNLMAGLHQLVAGLKSAKEAAIRAEAVAAAARGEASRGR